MDTTISLKLGRCLHKRDFTKLAEVYPALTASKPARLLLTYCLNMRRVRTERFIPLSAIQWERYVTGNPHLERVSGNYPVTAAVQALEAAVPGLTIELSTYNIKQEKARDIISLVLPTRLSEILYCTTDDEAVRQGLIDVASLDPVSSRQYAALCQQLRDEANTLLPDLCIYAWQEPWVTFLNTQHARRFSVSAEGVAAVRAYLSTVTDPEQYERHALMASRYIECPTNVYLPCVNSARLRGLGLSLQCMPTALRRALYPKAIDVDLKACQAVILNQLLQSPQLKAVLEVDGSPFNTLMREMGWTKPHERKMVKRAFYSLCYGAAKEHLFHDAIDADTQQAHGITTVAALHALEEEWSLLLAGTPLMKDLLKRRSALLSEIRNGRVLTDYYGRQHMMPREGDHREKGVKPRHILARYAQAQEQYLMAPVRDYILASQNTLRPLTCLAYQSDGLFLQGRERDRLELAAKTMAKQVEDRARAVGITTTLEYT